MPKFKSINIHPSLLPKYRGASPIQSAILKNEKETGISLMLMDEKMDHGPLLAKHKIQITKNKMATEFQNELAEISSRLLLKTIPDYISKKIKSIKQNHSQATFCKIIKSLTEKLIG